ncbi:uncharacterized protein [Nicotiana tomentosiformis]|uniref:uncharacterized protein n=1 Tax=Nicotiana tomentosiformis TaxID=4098 RepID=UPI00388CB034
MDHVEDGKPILHPRLSATSVMVAALMMRQGYEPEKGLGASLQGISEPISLFSNRDNCAKHEIQSLVDCYAGYHQILMDDGDAEKTAFTTPWDEEIYSIEEVVPDDNHVWKMYFDGAVNIKGVGIGAILISPIGQYYPATARLHFFCTNNTAEYEACIMGLNLALDLDVNELLVMGDSDLLIRQTQGKWETRDIKLIPYRQCVQDLSKRFKSIVFKYIPRFHNELADALATLASMLPYPGNTHIDPLEIQVRNQHGYCHTIEIEPDGELCHFMKEVCEKFKIMHRHFTPCWPKANGAVEAANKNIKKILKKIIQGSKQWHEKLPFALLGYRTTTRTSVGATPYPLVYGTKVVIPAEVEIPSLWIIVESEIEDTEWVKT